MYKKLIKFFKNPLIAAVIGFLAAIIPLFSSETISHFVIVKLDWKSIAQKNGWVDSKSYEPDLSNWMKIEDCKWDKREYITLNSLNDTVRIEIRFSERGRWKKGNASIIESEPNGPSINIIEDLKSLDLIKAADGIISVGLASQEIEKDNPQIEQSRALNRGSNLLRYIGKAGNTDIKQNFYILNLGRYIGTQKNISEYESSDQRRVIIVGIFSITLNKMSTSEIERKVIEAFNDTFKIFVNVDHYSAHNLISMQR